MRFGAQRLGLVAGVAIVVASCAEPRVATRAPDVNLSGYSVAFKQGYAHGCASIRGERKRDDARFKTDDAYARGWNDGYAICKR